MAGSGAEEAVSWTQAPRVLPASWRDAEQVRRSGQNPVRSGTRRSDPGRRLRIGLVPEIEVPLGRDTVQRFLDAVRDEPRGEALAVLERLADRGVAVDRIYTEVVAPAARELGRLWEDDRCDFFEVTLAVGVMQQLMRGFGSAARVDARVGIAVPRAVYLTTVVGEQHTLGLVMLGDLFLRAGWSVTMGAPFETEAAGSPLGIRKYDLIGMSVSRDSSMNQVEDLVRHARGVSLNAAVPVLLGGGAIGRHPGCVQELGGDGTADDGPGAVAVARALV
jgi:MerR family transcriptional regulator, light-induced transcriptional regulator